MSDISSKNLYSSNLERWALFDASGAAALQEQGSNLDPTVRVQDPNDPQVLISDEWHSLNTLDDAQSMQDLLHEIDSEKSKVLFVYGLGSGGLLEVLEPWLSDPEHHLICLEDNLAVIKAFLSTPKAKAFLSHPNVWLHYLDDKDQGLDAVVRMYTMHLPKVSVLPIYKKLSPRRYYELKFKIECLYNMQRYHDLENLSFGGNFFTNFFSNLFFLPTAYLGNGLFDQFKGVPAIICGAGPSLAKNIDLLATLGDRALIFAGASALNAVNAKNISPHFGVGVDPNFEQATRVIMQKAYDTPFFYRSRMNNVALGLVGGERLYLSGSSGYEISKYFDRQFNIEDVDLKEGFNVVNLSVAIAAHLGCHPIILVGVDLAYSDNKSYVDGVTSHPIHANKKLFRTKEKSEELLNRKDINGQPVLTLWKWLTESLWFSNFASTHPDNFLINSTEGGIGFTGVPNITLKEVAEKYLTKHYDFANRLHGEIQSHHMPPNATDETLIALIQNVQESLKRISEKMAGWTQTKQYFSSAELEEELKDEIGYEFILKDYVAIYDSYNSLSIKRLQIDAGSYGADELKAKQEILINQRDIFLIQAAVAINKKISDELQDHDDEQKAINQVVYEKASPATATPNKGSTYSFEKGVLKVIDPEFGLNHEEKFQPTDSETVKLYDTNGKLKYECYYRSNRLHGPSSSYVDGKLVGRYWFIDGQCQGVALCYYPDGALYSISRFKNDKHEGLQERFYANGCLRSHMSYENGLLHGKLLMNSETGMPSRELTFIHGKRQGTEKIWNQSGKLLIEAEFSDDKPSGTARVWSENGVLIQETIYSPSGEVVDFKRWDAQGNPSQVNQIKKTDFYEDLAFQSGTLVDNLSKISQTIQTVAPMIPESIRHELLTLNKELAHLQEIQSQMLFESGLDPSNTAEAIWKSPSMQREIQQKLDVMTKHMQASLSKLQGSLAHAITEMKKKPPTDPEQK